MCCISENSVCVGYRPVGDRGGAVVGEQIHCRTVVVGTACRLSSRRCRGSMYANLFQALVLHTHSLCHLNFQVTIFLKNNTNKNLKCV